MKFSASLLVLAVVLRCQYQVSAEFTFGSSTGYFPKGKLCGSHYTFDLVPRTWQDAWNYCRSQGGDLVSIETAEEHEYLKRIIANNRNNPLLKAQVAKFNWFGFWTSGSDAKTEGKFVWTANGSPVTLKIWDHGQPDNHKNEDFIEILPHNGLLNDIAHHNRFFSICEF